MRVILLSDVKKVGKKGEVKEVADGYARNFLIMRGLAVAESDTSKKILAKQKEQEAIDDKENRENALRLKNEIESQVFEFKVKAKDGKVFNSISTKQLEDELAKHNIMINRKKIKDTKPISTLGFSNVKIELYKDVLANIKVKLVEE